MKANDTQLRVVFQINRDETKHSARDRRLMLA
jgi:hypothetical protein